MRDALDRVRPDRIGHGVRAVEEPDLVRRLADEGVVLEVCPGSNIALLVYPDLATHPLRRLFDAPLKSISAELPSPELRASSGCLLPARLAAAARGVAGACSWPWSADAVLRTAESLFCAPLLAGFCCPCSCRSELCTREIWVGSSVTDAWLERCSSFSIAVFVGAWQVDTRRRKDFSKLREQQEALVAMRHAKTVPLLKQFLMNERDDEIRRTTANLLACKTQEMPTTHSTLSLVFIFLGCSFVIVALVSMLQHYTRKRILALMDQPKADAPLPIG